MKNITVGNSSDIHTAKLTRQAACLSYDSERGRDTVLCTSTKRAIRIIQTSGAAGVHKLEVVTR